MVTLVTFITAIALGLERFHDVADMGIGPSLQAFEEVFPTLPYDSFTPSGTRSFSETSSLTTKIHL